MNDRIKQLTRNCLDSLNLSYYQLNDNQKQEIIRINGETEWIIFNAGSLQGKLIPPGTDPYSLYIYSPEAYDFASPPLWQIFQEIIKVYNNDSDEIDINYKFVNFTGGSGTEIRRGHQAKIAAIPLVGNRGDEGWWIAVNKEALAQAYEHYFTFAVDNSRNYWKKETNLNNLLNDNEITNSREKVATSPNQQTNNNPSGNDNNTNNQQQTPPRNQTTTIRDLTFLIDHVIPGYNGNPHFITLSFPLVVEGFNIHFLTIQSNDSLLQDGNQVIIRDVELGPGRAEVDAYIEEISIKNYFRTIELVSTTPPPGGGSRTPNNPPPPPSFPDVVKKNHDLINEENGLTQLYNELKDIINKNKSVVQEAQTLGLTLPSFSDNALDFFETAPFVLFDAGQPLNSPFNQQTSDKNDKTRQKVLNLKNNIYQIYNSNVKKLNEKKQGEQGGSPPPENELTKLKNQVINKINNILSDPDNLRNIDLNTLAGGKYRNWENDIMGLNTVDEVNDYLNAFSTALKEKGAEEKEEEEQEKNDNSSDHDSQKNDNVIDDKTKNFISNLPLPSAKNVVKNKILELFRKNRPDLEKLKEIWAGYDSWMDYLDNLTSSAEVVTFLEKMEQAMVQQSQNRETRASAHPPQNSAIVPLLIIGFILLLGLIIMIIKTRRKKNK
ncbi:MAG: hypothetical protein MRERV_2c100 [Mycoplasmataceae bacterium RV_VA103A]|nr:MAG: hypothetical protein MRERV_2c100 [Mycoplasmataceae bacterium RV_VA103A]